MPERRLIRFDPLGESFRDWLAGCEEGGSCIKDESRQRRNIGVYEAATILGFVVSPQDFQELADRGRALLSQLKSGSGGDATKAEARAWMASVESMARGAFGKDSVYSTEVAKVRTRKYPRIFRAGVDDELTDLIDQLPDVIALTAAAEAELLRASTPPTKPGRWPRLLDRLPELNAAQKVWLKGLFDEECSAPLVDCSA